MVKFVQLFHCKPYYSLFLLFLSITEGKGAKKGGKFFTLCFQNSQIIRLSWELCVLCHNCCILWSRSIVKEH